MRISSNYGVNYSSCYQSAKSQRNVQPTQKVSSSPITFGWGFKRDDSGDPSPWYGYTMGEYRQIKREEEAAHRATIRYVLGNSPDPKMREASYDVGKNPALDEILLQQEFNRYHAEVMAERAAKEAALREAAGKKNYDGEEYTIKDEKGRVVERGKGSNWEKRYEYDIKYYVERYGEHYTMNEAVKESRSDGTYIINASPYSRTRLEEKFKNGSVEYVDNCTGAIKSVDLPDGRTFRAPRGYYMDVKRTSNSRQYISYDNEKVLLEVFDNGTYVES